MKLSNRQIIQSSTSSCNLCPRGCGVDRLSGKTGFCKAGNVAEIFRYGAHHGEEPPVSGTKGSGTIFFSRCTLSCFYCQNYPFSQEGKGERYSVERLSRVFRELRDEGCHNWNLVSPTPWIPMICEALEGVKNDGDLIPLVYNTSGYERVEVLKELEGIVNVYLVDLRYSDEATAKEASDAKGYVASARAAVMEMWRQTGPLRSDKKGVAVSGTICRLLILPGRSGEVIKNLEWLAENVGTDIAVSVMSQYMPAYRAACVETWGRGIEKDEYDAVKAAMEDIGFSEGWMQEFGGSVPKELIGYKMGKVNS